METINDKALWHLAKKRAGFKRHLTSYVLVNTFLWAIYLLSSHRSGIPWPVWTTLGWGIGLTFSYIGAYHSLTVFSTEKEYEKLKEQYS